MKREINKKRKSTKKTRLNKFRNTKKRGGNPVVEPPGRRPVQHSVEPPGRHNEFNRSAERQLSYETPTTGRRFVDANGEVQRVFNYRTFAPSESSRQSHLDNPYQGDVDLYGDGTRLSARTRNRIESEMRRQQRLAQQRLAQQRLEEQQRQEEINRMNVSGF